MLPRPLLAVLVLGLFSRLSVELEYYDDSPEREESLCTSPECIKSSGGILSAMDFSADPCKDFYQYACGGFELRQNIPAGENKMSQFSLVDKVIQKQLRKLLEDDVVKETYYAERQKARRYYKSCLDIETVVTNSAPEMKQMSAKMECLIMRPNEAVSRSWNLNQALISYESFSDSGLFGVSVGPDEMNVTQNVIILDQGSLSLGPFTRDYYVHKNVTADPILVGLTNFAEKLAKLVLGDRVVIDRSLILEVIQFDKRRAEIQQTQAELQDRLATYNKVNISYLQANFNFLNWAQYFNDMFAPVSITIGRNEPIVLFGVPYFQRLTALVNEYLQKTGGKRTLQNYFVLRALASYAPNIGGSFQAASDEFLAVYSGKRGSQERWEICLGDVNQVAGFALGGMYVEKYVSEKERAKATSVISNTIKTFRSRVQEAGWMDAQTRSKALEKVDALVYKVAYPDWLFDTNYMENRYSRFTVTDDYVQNTFAAFNYTKFRQLEKLRQVPDRSDWMMAPHTVNAYYDPTANTVVIPAGILNAPYFYAADGMPSALNFGSIGSIAGHEITHGFDSMGRQYDKLGNLKDWWNPESVQQFNDRSRCFIDKFNGYDVDGISVKGNQTLGENIADDGGIKTAFKAFKINDESASQHTCHKLTGLANLSPEQLFFIGWAQSWCDIQTPASRILQVQVDSHAPDRFRIMGPLSNSDDFTKAFNCPVGTSMRAEKKCSVW